MTINTITSLPSPVQQRFDMKLLARPEPDLIHKTMAMKKRLPDRSGNILRMRRYNNLSTATVPLGASGLNPPSQNLVAVDLDATVNWYGSFVVLTDQVTLINEDPVLNATTDLLAQSLRETEDELVRNMLLSSATMINAVNGSNGDIPTQMTRTGLNDVIRTLVVSNAKRITDTVQGENRFGTAPVRSAYFAMCDARLIPELEKIDGWIPTSQYPSQKDILSAEWGSVSNLRFLVSSVGSVSANASGLGNDVYNTFVCGQESYATIDLDGASSSFIYRPLGYGDDPLNQRQSCGYKFASAERILNDSWVINHRSTLS